MGERESELAVSFGRAAAEYERSWPSYPAEAVDWLLPEGARTVLDLGAGTGKLTRALVERGLETIAVEPSEEMRETLAAQLPGVRALAGTAEEIPLPDASVDAILARVRELVEADPALASREEFDLPYVTRCFRARLAEAP